MESKAYYGRDAQEVSTGGENGHAPPQNIQHLGLTGIQCDVLPSIMGSLPDMPRHMKIPKLAVKGRMCGVIITVGGGNVKILHHHEKGHRGEKLVMRTEHCALASVGSTCLSYPV